MAKQVEIIVPSEKTVEAVITQAKTARAIIESSTQADASISNATQAKAVIESGPNADALIMGAQGPEGPRGVPGGDGQDGQDGADGTISGALGVEGAVQYNSGQFLQGAKNFFYERANSIIKASGASIVIEEGTLKIDGGTSSTGLFLINDHNDKNVIRVDSQNQNILFSNDYSVGIGVSSPSEQVHIAKNLKVDKTGWFGEALYVQGNLVLTGVEPQNIDLSSYATKINLFETGSTLNTKIDTLDNKIDVASGYLDDKTDFLFLRTPVTSGVDGMTVEFPTHLGYDPKIQASFITRDNDKIWDGAKWNTVRYDAYTMAIYRITRTGYFVDFSDNISSTGYSIESFVSSEHFKH